MKTVVLTGPVCGGKSLLSGLLAERGGVVVDADRLGHRVLDEPDVRRELVRAFGSGVISGGGVDRRRLGEIVFKDPGALEQLNRITHPLLTARLDARVGELAAGAGVALAVVEAAVYFLLPTTFAADLVVAVTAPPEVLVDRLRRRNGLDEAAARARVRAQESLEKGWQQADLVLVNDGGAEILAQAADDIVTRLAPTGPANGHPEP